MTTADAKALVLRHHDDIWSKGDLALVDEVYAPDFVGRHPGVPDWIGPEGVKAAVRVMREAFPDFAETVEDVVAEGDRVMTRFTATGTHRGMLRDVAPTGRRIAMAEVGVFRIAGGRITEKWGLVDRIGLYQQLGLLPPVSPAMEWLYDVVMDVDVVDVGATPSGHRRIVRVTGGEFSGPRLRGRVLPGGGDWVLGRSDGSRRLDVRITLETEDGAVIYASYAGLLHGAPAVIARLAAGDDVEPADYYFRTTPLFETAAPGYEWLNRLVAVGYGRRTADRVAYTVYALR